MQRGAWIPLDEIIYDYISESEGSDHRYYKLFHIAFRGMDNMGLDFFYQIKSVLLPVNANKTANLPSDYLNYSKIGIIGGGGEIIPLTQNSNLASYDALNASRISRINANSLSNPYIYFNYWSGNGYTNLYGISGGAASGSFRIDNAANVIILSGYGTYNSIVLEYVASPKEDETYYIPVQFREAMIAWLSWKDISSIPVSRRGNLGDKRDRRHEYFNARRLAVAQYKPLHLEDARALNIQSQMTPIKM